MAVNLSPIWGAGAQLLDNSGNVLTGGKIYTYLAGTTTPATTYTSSNGNTANSNPIVLNSAGRVVEEIWLSFNQTYKFVLKDSNDTLIGTYDNIYGYSSGNNTYDYTGDGTTVTFPLPVGVALLNSIHINGVYQNKNTYSVTNGNIVFTEAPPFTSKIEIRV